MERYVRKDDRISVVLKMGERERNLHQIYTNKMQKEIEQTALALTVWKVNFTRKQLALLMLRTLLFANKERLQMLQMSARSLCEFKAGIVANGIRNLGTDKSVKISLWGLLAYPEEYMRYFCKIKGIMGNSLLSRSAYLPIGCVIYAWCGLSILRKHEKE